MNLLLDTNILFHLTKDNSYLLLIKKVNPDNSKLYLSIVSIGEIKALALKNKWGTKRRNILTSVLEEINAIEVNESLTEVYAELDAFSQCANPSYPNTSFSTPRNMGKNDLWIASTAALLGLKLITTDNDFNHLRDVFIEVECLKPEQLKS